MEPLSKPIEKRIHRVRSWLDAAAKSYASNAEAKGNFHLLLAQAEMAHMKEGKPSILTYIKGGAIVIALGLLMLVPMWLSQKEAPAPPVVVSTPVVTRPLETPKEEVSPTVEKAIVETTVIKEEGTPQETTQPTPSEVKVPVTPVMSSEDIRGAVQAGGRILRH